MCGHWFSVICHFMLRKGSLLCILLLAACYLIFLEFQNNNIEDNVGLSILGSEQLSQAA